MDFSGNDDEEAPQQDVFEQQLALAMAESLKESRAYNLMMYGVEDLEDGSPQARTEQPQETLKKSTQPKAPAVQASSSLQSPPPTAPPSNTPTPTYSSADKRDNKTLGATVGDFLALRVPNAQKRSSSTSTDEYTTNPDYSYVHAPLTKKMTLNSLSDTDMSIVREIEAEFEATATREELEDPELQRALRLSLEMMLEEDQTYRSASQQESQKAVSQEPATRAPLGAATQQSALPTHVCSSSVSRTTSSTQISSRTQNVRSPLNSSLPAPSMLNCSSNQSIDTIDANKSFFRSPSPMSASSRSPEATSKAKPFSTFSSTTASVSAETPVTDDIFSHPSAGFRSWKKHKMPTYPATSSNFSADVQLPK